MNTRKEGKKMIISWIIRIIFGAISGTLAGKIMKSNQPLWINIILGIVGGAIAGAVLGLFIAPSGIFGWVTDIIFGVIGACALIYVVRLIKKK